MNAKHVTTAEGIYKSARVIKTGDGTYEYRGISIERDESQRGYCFYWQTSYRVLLPGGARVRLSAATRKELIRDIDRALDGRAPLHAGA